MKSSVVAEITAMLLLGLVMLFLCVAMRQTQHRPRMPKAHDTASDTRYKGIYNYTLDRIIELWIKEPVT